MKYKRGDRIYLANGRLDSTLGSKGMAGIILQDDGSGPCRYCVYFEDNRGINLHGTITPLDKENRIDPEMGARLSYKQLDNHVVWLSSRRFEKPKRVKAVKPRPKIGLLESLI